MQKENKELKAKRKQMLTQAETEYVAKKKKYTKDIPKYLKATKIDLDQMTFRLITGVKKKISEKEMTDFMNNETLHSQKRAQLIELKRQLDA